MRIAGVNVGKVESVRSVCDNGLTGNCASNYSEVTFTVDSNGQPVRSDAQVEIRPRIFLEGNFFLDLSARQPERPLPRQRRHDSDDPDLDRGPARPDPDLAPGARPGQPPEAAQGLRDDAHPQADGRRRRDAGSGGSGQDRRRGDQQVLRLRQDRRAGLRDRQRGAPGHDGARSLQPDRRAGEGVRIPHRPRVPAPGPDHATSTPSPERSPPSPRTCSGRSGCSVRPSRSPSPRCATPTRRCPTCGPSRATSTPGIRELPATIAASQPWIDQTAALLGKNELGYIASQLRAAGPGAGKSAADGRGLFSPDRPAERLRRQRAAARRRRRAQRLGQRLQLRHRRAELQGVRLRAPPVSPARAPRSTATGPRCGSSRAGGPTPTGGPVPNLRSPVPGAVSTRGNALWGGSTTPPIGTRPGLGSKPPFRTDVACQNNPLPDLNGPLAAQGPPDPAPYP